MAEYEFNPQEMLEENLAKGYIGVRVRSAGALHDRELNLLGELGIETLRRTLASVIQDGVLEAGDGLRIETTGQANDIRMLSGTSLVDGHLVRATAIRYGQQSGAPPLVEPAIGETTSYVYFEVWQAEVDPESDRAQCYFGAEQVSDRRILAYRLVVSEEPLPALQEGRGYLLLANLRRRAGQPVIAPEDIADRRAFLPPLVEVNEKIAATSEAAAATARALDTRLNVTQTQVADLSGKMSLSDAAVRARLDSLTASLAAAAERVTALERSLVPSGIIVLWHGTDANLPIGWFLCDGQNGTPDLRERFVLGAGFSAAHTKGPGDAHSHSIPPLTINGRTDHGGEHRHKLPAQWYDRELAAGGFRGIDSGPVPFNPDQAEHLVRPDESGHSHSFTAVTGGAITRSASTLRPPWYALCYIMKS
jgi:hypothetical protein